MSQLALRPTPSRDRCTLETLDVLVNPCEIKDCTERCEVCYLANTNVQPETKWAYLLSAENAQSLVRVRICPTRLLKWRLSTLDNRFSVTSNPSIWNMPSWLYSPLWWVGRKSNSWFHSATADSGYPAILRISCKSSHEVNWSQE